MRVAKLEPHVMDELPDFDYEAPDPDASFGTGEISVSAEIDNDFGGDSPPTHDDFQQPQTDDQPAEEPSANEGFLRLADFLKKEAAKKRHPYQSKRAVGLLAYQKQVASTKQEDPENFESVGPTLKVAA